MVHVLVRTREAAAGQHRVAAVGVRPLVIGGAGVGVIVGQQVVLGGGVDGAVDGAVVGRRAALLRVARVAGAAGRWGSETPFQTCHRIRGRNISLRPHRCNICRW